MAKVRYIGDGSHYVIGYPAVPDAIEEVDDEVAARLVSTGLYEPVGRAPAKRDRKDADGAAPTEGGQS